MLNSSYPFFNSYLDLFDSKHNHNFMNTDIIERENNYILKIEIPGIKKEICYGEYSRKFYVGSIDENLIEANYNNGILMINIPKESKIDNKKNIEIK